MTTIQCEDLIRQQLRHMGEKFSCKESGGRLWIVSPYSFPDGDLVEVAVREVGNNEVMVSDLGETLRHLAGLGYDPRETPKGEYLLAEILKQHQASLDQGIVLKRVAVEQVGMAMHEVLAACVAVSHLSYLSRGYRPATFAEEVSHILTESQILFETKHPEMGRTGKKYAIDFYIPGPGREGLLQTLSPANRGVSTPMVNATFRLWSDVSNGRWRGTVLDDRLIEWRREDVALLEGVSSVFFWKEGQGSLVDSLSDAV